MPYTTLEPIVSQKGNQVTNALQCLGSTITYLRRYLYQLALDIVENDNVEPIINRETEGAPIPPKPVTKSFAPPTVEERKEVVETLTTPKVKADEMQLKGLKMAIKRALEVKPEIQEWATKLAMDSNNFTNISKEDCKEIIKTLMKVIEGANK